MHGWAHSHPVSVTSRASREPVQEALGAVPARGPAIPRPHRARSSRHLWRCASARPRGASACTSAAGALDGQRCPTSSARAKFWTALTSRTALDRRADRLRRPHLSRDATPRRSSSCRGTKTRCACIRTSGVPGPHLPGQPGGMRQLYAEGELVRAANNAAEAAGAIERGSFGVAGNRRRRSPRRRSHSRQRNA